MTTPEFRRLSSEWHTSFQQVVDYAFSADDGPQQYDESAALGNELG